MEHTKLPWKFDYEFDDEPAYIYADAASTDDGEIATVASGNDCLANARLIVKAVNNFDELVWCLKWFVAANEMDYSLQDMEDCGFFKKAAGVLLRLEETTDEAKCALVKDTNVLQKIRGE